MDALRGLIARDAGTVQSHLGDAGREVAGERGDGGATSESSRTGRVALSIGRPIPQEDNGSGAR